MVGNGIWADLPQRAPSRRPKSSFSELAEHLRNVPLYLSPEVGSYAQMSLTDMQQFIAGSYVPTDEQVRALA